MRDTRRGRKQSPIDMSGGMNTREDPSVLRGGFRLIQDADVAEGTARIRKGWAKVNTTAIACDYCIGGFAYKKRDDTVVELWAGDNSTIYRIAAGVVSAVTLNKEAAHTYTWDATYIADFAQWRDDCYITIAKPGVNTSAGTYNLRYDGAAGAVFEAGMTAPAAPTVADGGAGTMTGTYNYRVQFKDVTKGYYSAPGAISATITVAGKKVSLTGIPVYSGTGRTIHRVILRSADTSTTWDTLTTITNNTTTTLTDDHADQSTLTTAASLSAMVPACGCVCARSDGLLFFGNDKTNNMPARVFYVDSNDEPEHQSGSSTTSGKIEITGQFDRLVSMEPYQDGILCLHRNSRHHIPRGQFVAHQLAAGDGSVAVHGAVVVEGSVAFLSDAGPRVVVGNIAPFVGSDDYGPESGSRQFILKRTWDSVAKDRLYRACAHHDRTRAEVEWHVETDNTTNYCDLTIVWNYRTNTVRQHKRWIWQAWEVPVASSEEYRVHAAFPLGFVGRLESGIGDGAGASAYVEGGTLSATATSLTSDLTDLSVVGDGHKGTRITIFYGTDQWDVQYVGSNNASVFFLSDSFLDGAWAVTPDTTSKWVLGMQDFILDVDGIKAAEDAGITYIAHEAEFWMGDENRGAESEDL